jgi:NitT/TauT family transport system permease protein
MGISVLIALALTYLSKVPLFCALGTLVSLFRFLSLTGLIFVFTVILKDGHNLKLALVIFVIVPYFVTSLLSYIEDISDDEFKLAATLKMGPWHSLWEVVILGRAHLVFEVIKQNFAYGWSMIVSIEGLSLSEGGIGTLLIKSNRHMLMNEVFGMLLVILVVGALFDYTFDAMKVFIMPYVDLKRSRKMWLNRLLIHAIIRKK